MKCFERFPGSLSGAARSTLRLILMTFWLTSSWACSARAQAGVEPISATDVPWSEIQAVLDSPVGGADRQVRVVDIGPHNVAIGVLHRNATVDRGGPVRGIVHTHVAEVYYVISGSGTLVTGGELSNQSAPMSGQIVAEVVGPSFTAESTGGVSRIVSVGDVIVIPAGVFHGWPSVPDHVTYLSVRPDPDRVLPAGFVNPVIE